MIYNRWTVEPHQNSDGYRLIRRSKGGSTSFGYFTTTQEAIVEMDKYEDEYGRCATCDDVMIDKKSHPYLKDNCFTCNFWAEKIEAVNDPRSVRIDGGHYWIGDEDPTNRFRGFGGRRFNIKFHDGREVQTTNLWHQGQIPEHFRDILPDNAEWGQ